MITLILIMCSFFFFFFQAEDGIRDHCVTGVQTCALPILPSGDVVTDPTDPSRRYGIATSTAMGGFRFLVSSDSGMSWSPLAGHGLPEIGRASCRERV